MNTRNILINVITVIFVCFSLYFLKTTNTGNAILSKKDSVLSRAQDNVDQATQALLNSINKTEKQTTLATQSYGQVVTPEPLQQLINGLKSDSTHSIDVSGVITRTNYERAQNGFPALNESAKLDASANMKALDILKRQYFEHTSPDGKTVSDLVKIFGYDYVRVGENLALGDFNNNNDLLDAWMNSPGHRANILDKRYQDIGVGVAYGKYQGQYVVVVVQHFGRPLSSCPFVDKNLKQNILDIEDQITKLSNALDTLKNEINTRNSSGVTIDSTVIDTYNISVNRYESLVNQSNQMRDKYNTQVNLFNTCLDNLNK